MKINACIFFLIGAVLIYGCSKREVFAPVWHQYAVEVVYKSPSDSTLSKTGPVYTTYVYSGDSLLRIKRSVKERDTINIPVGRYNFISVNLSASGVRFGSMDKFHEARLLLNSYGNMSVTTNPLRDVFSSTVKEFYVAPATPNTLNINLINQVKNIEYQLIIEGAKDSLERCVITQHGVSKGFLFHNNQLIFDPAENTTISAEASRVNNFTGTFSLLGVDPDKKELEIKFVYTNQKTQNTTLELNQLEDEYIYSKRLVIYIDITRINMELKASVKSWIIVEDKINI
jgi:hypothetical protein